jgi:ParB family chromosome partitioning protein
LTETADFTQPPLPPAEVPAPAADAGGIGPGPMIAAEVELTRMAPHPANPRTTLGDLTELQASIAQVGILEPLVVVTVAAHTAAGWPAPGQADATHVMLAGHRRHQAAIDGGQAYGPAVVRDDLAGDKALIVMLTENGGEGIRKGLEPLAEARAMHQLVARGWSQRQIATELGCAQGQVSKRLALLKLPPQHRRP